MAASANPNFQPLKGNCTCKALTYTLTAPPLITHCCHCTFCQRESGTAFAINTMIEAYNFHITSDTSPVVTGIPSLSSPKGDKHLVAHCPTCLTVIYAHYSANRACMFVRAGTLDDESRKRVRPDVHIFTSSKVEWLDLRAEEEKGIKVCDEYYVREEVWSQENLRRREVLLQWAEKQKEEESTRV